MANALEIQVKETVKELKALLKKAISHHQPRLRMLIVIKESETSLSKNDLAELIGVNHNSIQTWRQKYLKGGITLLLKDGRIGFKPSVISKSVHQSIKEELFKENASFSSYKQLHSWVDKNLLKGVNYNSLRHYVKRNFGASLKVPRKSHIKKDIEASNNFKKTSVKSTKKQ
jgi:transposase